MLFDDIEDADIVVIYHEMYTGMPLDEVDDEDVLVYHDVVADENLIVDDEIEVADILAEIPVHDVQQLHMDDEVEDEVE